MSTLLEWLGVDGSVWDLRSGPVRLAPGAQGLGMIPLTAFTQDRGVRSGQRFVGWRVDPQTISLPLRVGWEGWRSTDWETFSRSWWKACRPHRQGTLRVTATDGSVRTVAARVTSDGPLQWDQDPADLQLEDVDLTFVADVPWWLGQPISAPYGTATPSPFYGGTGFGPPFYVSAANSMGQQSIANPGDVDAWPVWELVGPVSAFSIAAGTATLAGTPNLLAGERLVIDSGEDAKSATRYAVDGTPTLWTPNLTSYGFASVPAGTSTTFAVSLTGSGTATATIVPRYFRPIY